jgi:hypothetical protein
MKSKLDTQIEAIQICMARCRTRGTRMKLVSVEDKLTIQQVWDNELLHSQYLDMEKELEELSRKGDPK